MAYLSTDPLAGSNYSTQPVTPPGGTPFGPPVASPTPSTPAPTGAAGAGGATTQQAALQEALQQGLKGQAAVDYVQQHYPQFNQYGSGIAYDAQRGNYGGAGWYAAPGSGQYGFDWVQRSGGGGSGGGVTPGAGYLNQVYGGQYNLPTEQEALNMPGMQFAIDQAGRAVQSSAAAKGTLLTGGTLKALAGYTTGTALQGYGQLAGLSNNAFNTNYNIDRNNRNDLFGRYYNLANLGYQANS